ncbi:hypothetical protein RJ640_024974 [Escallonia rubra]|uniref:Uncharacterized protein n=1 Tax=Escallonia rubra TaxID=112253 RepID=A0AA88R5Q7_9ASTE|nr:hypothetical protein RJ640_024974 [Escallonia rubra]
MKTQCLVTRAQHMMARVMYRMGRESRDTSGVAQNFKKPATLFTDQDIAMGNAVGVVMPKAGLDGNLLSSLSQGSNDAQFNGKKVSSSSVP